jgi:hypothetical protein
MIGMRKGEDSAPAAGEAPGREGRARLINLSLAASIPPSRNITIETGPPRPHFPSGEDATGPVTVDPGARRRHTVTVLRCSGLAGGPADPRRQLESRATEAGKWTVYRSGPDAVTGRELATDFV